jgi:hypothetical protein
MNSRHWRSSGLESPWVRSAGFPGEEMPSPSFSPSRNVKRARSSQRLGAVGLAADEAEGLADRAAVGCEPVVQELQELAELHGYLELSRQPGL